MRICQGEPLVRRIEGSVCQRTDDAPESAGARAKPTAPFVGILLCSIPGISQRTARSAFLQRLVGRYRAFLLPAISPALAGLCPGNHESAGQATFRQDAQRQPLVAQAARRSSSCRCPYQELSCVSESRCSLSLTRKLLLSGCRKSPASSENTSPQKRLGYG